MERLIKIRNGGRLFGPWKFYSGALAIAVPIMLQSLIQSLVFRCITP